MATYAFILTCLMTDRLTIIFLAFTIILVIYGTTVGINPLITIPKTLLGRHDAPYLRRILSAQVVGATLAFLTYHILIKTKVTRKHPLDRL